ncbi:MAG: hypothetical protein WCV92_05100 [Candidatus Buchananbacteria bacterium]
MGESDRFKIFETPLPPYKKGEIDDVLIEQQKHENKGPSHNDINDDEIVSRDKKRTDKLQIGDTVKIIDFDGGITHRRVESVGTDTVGLSGALQEYNEDLWYLEAIQLLEGTYDLNEIAAQNEIEKINLIIDKLQKLNTNDVRILYLKRRINIIRRDSLL